MQAAKFCNKPFKRVQQQCLLFYKLPPEGTFLWRRLAFFFLQRLTPATTHIHLHVLNQNSIISVHTLSVFLENCMESHFTISSDWKIPIQALQVPEVNADGHLCYYYHMSSCSSSSRWHLRPCSFSFSTTKHRLMKAISFKAA